MSEAFQPLRIPVLKAGGCWWEKGLQESINHLIAMDADYVITIDGDSIFKRDDVEELLRVAVRRPEADVIAPWQVARGRTDFSLVGIKGEDGEPIRVLPSEAFSGDVTRVDIAAFGLTLIKVEALKKMPKPWWLNIPNADGEWKAGKIDADGYFWRQASEAGLTVYVANNVRIGHLYEGIVWIDPQFKVIRQDVHDYGVKGRPF